MSIVLRASGGDRALDACVSRVPAERIDAQRRAGDKVGLRVAKTSGFNLLLADDCSEASLVAASSLLRALSGPLLELVESEASVEVDVALFVSGPATSVRFPVDFLAAVAALGAQLRVSGYATSDE